MIMGSSRKAKAFTAKMADLGHALVLISGKEAYLESMHEILTGKDHLTFPVDLESHLEIQTAFEATLDRFGNVNSFVHFSGNGCSPSEEVLDFVQSSISPDTGASTTKLKYEWITKKKLEEVECNYTVDEQSFGDILKERVQGEREFEGGEQMLLLPGGFRPGYE